MREANKLNPKFIAAAKPGKWCDGRGLWLYVQAGRKSWVLRYMMARKPREMGLGPVELVSLKEARALAYEARRLVLQGRDPIAERKADRRKLHLSTAGMTFGKAAEMYVSAHQASWRSKKHGQDWKLSLDRYAK